jgi:hypothetical protein
MSIHYVRYHKATVDNSIASTPGAFEAWVDVIKSRPNQTPCPQPGDIVWVLSGKKLKSGEFAFKLEYHFEVTEPPRHEGERIYLRGTKGVFLEDRGLIQSKPWFKDFFDSFGRGGLSIKPVRPEYLPHFLDLYGASTDRLNALRDQADGEADGALAALEVRRGEAEFRSRLLEAYSGRCAVTGCRVSDVLEAAFIDPSREDESTVVNNGILLRADVRTLFDLHLLGVDSTERIVVAKRLRDSEYGKLHGARLAPPSGIGDRPSAHGLARRLKQLRELEASGA